MITKHLLIITMLSGFTVRGQTVTPVVVSSQGGFATGSSGSIAWTIGEPLSETRQTGSHIFTQGFHQPDLSIPTLLREQGSDTELLVYPNPVKESLSVNFKDMPAKEYLLRLTDAQGKIIEERRFRPSAYRSCLDLDVAGLADAAYFIHVSSKDFNKTVKIIKTQ